MIKCAPLIIFLIVASNALLGQAPMVKKSASWFQRGYYILNPSLAHNEKEVAFVRRLSGKDSTIEAEDFLKGVDKSFLSQSGIAVRQNDPVISLFNIENKKVSLLDYGWSPTFSANDSSIAYAFQLNTLQKQDKLYAEVYKGNSIKIFSKLNQNTEEVASPLGNYLLDPFFVDSFRLVYKAGDKVNGPYGAAISLSEVNLKDKKTKLIQQAAVKYHLYELVGETYLINNKLAYVVYSPADSGTKVAGKYLHLLMSATGDTLHNFGVRKFINLSYKFAFNDKKELLFLDDQHFLPEDSNYLLTYKNNELVNKKVLDFKYAKAYLSPNGKYMIYFKHSGESYIVNLKNFAETKVERPQKELHAIVWSANGNGLLLVQDHERYIGTDELLIYEIQ